MGEFQGSLKVVGDAASVPADLALREGRLVIKSGDHSIGDWALADMDLVQKPDGIHMKVEGEHLLLEVADPTAFAVAAGLHDKIAVKSKVPRLGRRLKKASDADTTRTSTESKAVDKNAATAAPLEKPASTRSHRSLPKPIAKVTAWWADSVPVWARGRAAIVAAVVFLVLAIIYTTVVSTVIIVAGIVALIAGAFGMTDQLVAARFPAHITPMGCILGGSGLIVFGILVGILL